MAVAKGGCPALYRHDRLRLAPGAGAAQREQATAPRRILISRPSRALWPVPYLRWRHALTPYSALMRIEIAVDTRSPGAEENKHGEQGDALQPLSGSERPAWPSLVADTARDRSTERNTLTRAESNDSFASSSPPLPRIAPLPRASQSPTRHGALHTKRCRPSVNNGPLPTAVMSRCSPDTPCRRHQPGKSHVPAGALATIK